MREYMNLDANQMIIVIISITTLRQHSVFDLFHEDCDVIQEGYSDHPANSQLREHCEWVDTETVNQPVRK